MEDIIYDEENKIKAGTLLGLICKLTEDADFAIEFLYSYRTFTTPDELVRLLIERFQSAAGSDPIRLRVLAFFSVWTDRFWNDFEKECPALGTKVISFLNQIEQEEESLSKPASVLKESLQQKLSAAPPVALTPELNFNAAAGANVVHLLNMSSEEIAQQLTLMDWNIWKRIQHWEFLRMAWMSQDKDTLAPNVVAMIKRFNQVSSWVTSMICMTEDKQERIQVCAKFLEVAKCLEDLNNYNGVFCIISALSRSAVERLKDTWTEMDEEHKALKKEMTTKWSNPNSVAHRQKLQATTGPCIPYLGLYLTDLVFLEDGNPDQLGNLINFTKRRLMVTVINQILAHQLVPYDFAPIPEIMSLLCEGLILSEEQLHQLSLYIEPRANRPKPDRPDFLP